MSTKRSRRNIVDTSLTSNSKKSRNTITETNEDVCKNGKNKKKENTNVSLNVKKPVEKKRKLSESDITSYAKKTKKRGKLCTNLNNTDNVNSLPSIPSDNFNGKKELKKSKKSKVALINDECCIEIDSNNSVELVEPFMPKSAKKKVKASKVRILNEQQITSGFQKENYCSSSKDEVGTSYKMNVHGNHNEIKVENANPEQCVHNGVIHISVRDLDDYHSDINEIEFFPELIRPTEISKKKPKTKQVTNNNINWPEEDLKELVNRMDACIPEYDTLAFGTRAEKLDWDSIAFKQYSVEDCKNMWGLLQKQVRRFRVLKEVLEDAKVWLSAPKSKKRKKKAFRHPDMPRKPLTAYIIYYLQKKDDFNKTHPGLDAPEISKVLGQEFKTLTPEVRLKYEHLAAKKKKEYEKKLEEFYQTHPDVPRIVKTPRIRSERKPKPPKPPKLVKEKPPKPLKERIPKRPPTPFHYYHLSELENQKQIDDRIAFKELCKDRWKQLPDERKVVWINTAETEYAKYEEALAKYLAAHPEYIQNPHKPLLTKEEVQIKDRVAGKPSKPPCSAYNLFARVLLQSDEIKNVNVKDRLIFVSNQWKNCLDEEKKQYRDLSLKLNEKYKLDYASYLETLPEEERKLEIEKSMPKRRKSECVEPEKKEKVVKKKVEKKPVTRKIVEPEQPPISAFKYFASLYTGKESTAQAWKHLSPEQKKIYEDELVKKKQAYIMDFEIFLKSLTKDELEAFSNSRRRIKKETEDEEDEEEEGETETDESGTEDSGAGSNADEDDAVN